MTLRRGRTVRPLCDGLTFEHSSQRNVKAALLHGIYNSVVSGFVELLQAERVRKACLESHLRHRARAALERSTARLACKRGRHCARRF